MKIVGCFLKGKIHHNLKEDNIFCVLLETGSQPWVMSNSLCSQSFALNPLLLYCYYHYYFETGSQCVVLAFLELSEVCLFLPLLSAGIKDVYNFSIALNFVSFMSQAWGCFSYAPLHSDQ